MELGGLLTESVIGAAIEVHRSLGPGMLEAVYSRCLARELEVRGIGYRTQVSVPITFKGMVVENAFRMDILVEDQLVLELKAVQALEAVHSAQLLTYLRAAHKPLGLLINFNVRMLKDGIQRLVL